MATSYSLTTLASFNNTNGANPSGSLFVDANGNLFGTTERGGGAGGYGTVFEVKKDSNSATGTGYDAPVAIASFNNTNGAYPQSSLFVDANGNLFGTTQDGGGAGSYGTVFEVKKDSNSATGTGYDAPVAIASFNNTNGANPQGSLFVDANGNLFGTTAGGGAAGGYGTVFEVKKDSNSATGTGYDAPVAIASFNNTNGANPAGSLFVDANGNLFGTTLVSGAGGYGTVFEVRKDSNSATGTGYDAPVAIASFNNTNGANPSGSLFVDANGNLFGTTQDGGASSYGTVFEVKKDSNSATGTGYDAPVAIASFNNTNGANPYASLFVDANGNFFGTTQSGGASGYGAVFEVKKDSNSATGTGYDAPVAIASFDNTNGANPSGSLFVDANGNLFGTTYAGGASGYGTVFELVNTTLAVTASQGVTAFVAGDNAPSTPVVIDPALSITKVDSANLTGATVQIINGKSGDEFGNGTTVLSPSGTFTSAGNVQLGYTYDPSTYTLTISGSDTATDYQTLLRGLSYASNLIVPDTTTRRIDFTATSGFLTSDPAEKDVTVADANPTPPAPGGGPSGPSTSPSSGADLLTGTAGPDTIAGLGGDDTINGVSGNDLLLGNQGNDTITDGDGNSTILGGMGNDGIAVGNGSNLLFGGEGADTIQAGNGGDTIVGGTGNAAIDSLDGADFITSGSGNDLILGNGGDDTIGAGGGNDTVAGGFGNDVILGNQGDDIILGNQGNDTLYGGYGNDTLVGGQGNDMLIGGQGDDVLYGNEGLNTFVFNPGDTDFKSGTSTGDTIMDFATGTSRIDFAAGPAGTATNFGAISTTSTDFASIQALAQALINGGDAYAFVADGVDGFLFTTGGTGTTITDAVKLAGAGTAGAVKYTDIAHGALG